MQTHLAGFPFVGSQVSDHSDIRQLGSRVAHERRHTDDCRTKARKFHVRKGVCESAKPAPVLCGVRVAEEAELDSHSALSPGGPRILGECFIYFHGASVFSSGKREQY